MVNYKIAIEEKILTPAGKPVKALTINGTNPGPTLRFTLGDTARIKVTNKLDPDSSIHWQGILRPDEQDGVP